MTAFSFPKKIPQLGWVLTSCVLLGVSLSESTLARSLPPKGGWLSESAETNSSNQTLTVTLPESVINEILRNASSVSGLPVSDLKIDRIEAVTWSNGCLGITSLNTACTMALVEGWRATVKSEQQQWVYHGSGSRFLLASGTNPTPPIADPPFRPWPFPIGTSQENPILPTVSRPNVWSFQEVPRGLWYDPPTAYGFQYKMTSDSVFTEILDFPTNFKKPFAVLVKDILLGEFTAGDRVNFKDYRTVLGDLLVGGSGVNQFSVTGINVDPTNPNAFPIKLDFNTDTASFDMHALIGERPPEAVPEPSSFLGCAVSGIFLVRALRKRQRKSSVPIVDSDR